MNHRIIVATISSGNVQHIERRNIRTVSGFKKIANYCNKENWTYKQIWMEEFSVTALGGEANVCYGEIGGTEVHIKNSQVMDTA